MSYRCSVFNCASKRKVKAKNIKLYGFPNKQGEEERKVEWIRFVRSTKPDGDNWEPSDLSVICSGHFVGGKKSNYELSPAYVPTLFPGVFTNIVTSDTEASEMLVTSRSSLRKINQKLRQEGKQYFGEKKTAEGVQLVVRKAREMGPPCTSPRCLQSPKSRFCHFFTEKERQDIFNQFWTMNLKYRKGFIRGLVDFEVPKRRRCRAEGSKRRTVQYKYHLKKNGTKYQVCKDVFLSTFGMKHWKFRFWLKPTDPEDKTLQQQEDMECDNNDEGDDGSEMDEEEDENEMKAHTSHFAPYDAPGPSSVPHFLAAACHMSGAFKDTNLSHLLATAVTARHPENKNIPPEELPHSTASSSRTDEQTSSSFLATALEGNLHSTSNVKTEPPTTYKASSSPEYENELNQSSEFPSMEHFVQVELKEMETEGVKCTHCDSIFENREKLEIHYINNSYCYICNIKYDNPTELYQHLLNTHIYNANTCGMCSKIMENNIENHMKIHSMIENRIDFNNSNNTSGYLCDNCNCEIVNSDVHVCTISLICFKCKTTHVTKQELLIHLIKDHFKNDRCKICCRNISVIGLANLELHVKYCEASNNNKRCVKSEICMKCHKEFSSNETLLEHHKKDHECTHCSDIFDRKNDLIEHLITNVHKIPGLVCKFCFVSFTERYLFIQHIVKHKQRTNGKS